MAAGEVDMVQALQIFPAEVWEIILENVTESADFANLCSSSLFFRSFLLEHRTLRLFSKILDKLTKKGYLGDGDKQYRGVRFCRHLLNLRRVCSVYATIIDGLLDKKVNAQRQKALTGEVELLPWRRQYAEASKVLRHFEQSHPVECERSPFLGHLLEVRLGEEDDMTPYGDNITALRTLIERYGEHIWHMTVLFERTKSICHFTPAEISGWLEWMPHLKLLLVLFSKHDNEGKKMHGRIHLFPNFRQQPHLRELLMEEGKTKRRLPRVRAHELLFSEFGDHQLVIFNCDSSLYAGQHKRVEPAVALDMNGWEEPVVAVEPNLGQNEDLEDDPQLRAELERELEMGRNWIVDLEAQREDEDMPAVRRRVVGSIGYLCFACCCGVSHPCKYCGLYMMMFVVLGIMLMTAILFQLSLAYGGRDYKSEFQELLRSKGMGATNRHGVGIPPDDFMPQTANDPKSILNLF